MKPVKRPVISFPAESDIAIDVGLRHADVLAFHGVTVAEAAEKVAAVRRVAGIANRRFGLI